MNILFIGYWGANDGLTTSTIIPNLSILSGFKHVNTIIFCSIERTNDLNFNISIPKVTHIPLFSKKSKIPLIDKVNDFTTFPNTLTQVCQKFNINKIISRGAPAGGLAYLTSKKTSIPFIVESFEPHADYMLESNVWSKIDPRYIIEKYWEKKAKQKAEHLVTVSENYKKALLKEGINTSRISTVPCFVDTEKFKFKNHNRIETRHELGIDIKTTVGVYVGKFGDIYLDKEAFKIFAQTLSSFPKSALVLLTPDSDDYINSQLNQFKEFNDIEVKILLAPHDKVPNYLSASDIAFATIRPAPSRKYCSAIKIGEYYANGLPIVITKGCGDDSEIIKHNKIGTVVDDLFNVNIEELKMNIESNLDRSKNSLTKVAKKHRSIETQIQVYTKLIPA